MRLEPTQRSDHVLRVSARLITSSTILHLSSDELERALAQEQMENPALEVSEQRICLFCGTWHPYGSPHRDEVPGGDGDWFFTRAIEASHRSFVPSHRSPYPVPHPSYASHSAAVYNPREPSYFPFPGCNKLPDSQPARWCFAEYHVLQP